MFSDWKVDKLSNIPIYKQIIEHIKDKIILGELSVGTKLPTQRILANMLEVNRSTIVEAMDELRSQGIIETRGKGGTIIINNTWSLIASVPPPNWVEYTTDGIYKPNKSVIQSINRLEFQKDIIRLGTGELSRELYPKKIFNTIMEKSLNRIDSLGYEQPKGASKLRETISKYLERYNIKCSPECVLIVSGSIQALQLISIGLLHPNSTILIEKPSYLKSLYIFESVGMKVKEVEMDSEGIIPKSIIDNRPKNGTTLLYTIPTYHNPTGINMSETRRKEILQVCERYRIPIIEDDAYRELIIDDEFINMPIKSIDNNGSVLYMGTISKSFAAGLRVGWLVGPHAVIKRLGDIKMQLDYGASSLSQYFVAELLSGSFYQEYLYNLRKELMVRRDKMLEVLNKYFYNLAKWNIPRGGFYIWLRLNKSINLDDLFKKAVSKGILINPGNIYDRSNNNCIRISYAFESIDNMETAIKKLSIIIQEYM